MIVSARRPAWLLVAAGEVPDADDWLSPGERAVAASLRRARRRSDWRLGRWAAKRALMTVLPVDEPTDLEVRAAPDGAPEAWFRGRRVPAAISLSHRSGLGACLVAAPTVAAGCDLETVEGRAPAFTAEWFTPRELAFVASAPPACRDLLTALTWSAKESALKAVREGLRLDPRDAEVALEGDGPGGWGPLAVDLAGRPLAGWWRPDAAGGWVLTVVTDPGGAPPADLAGGR